MKTSQSPSYQIHTYKDISNEEKPTYLNFRLKYVFKFCTGAWIQPVRSAPLFF